MKLQINTPLATVVDDSDVVMLRAQDASGDFGILPRHADFMTALTVSVVRWRNRQGGECYCAVRGGILRVSHGNEVSIATREAVASGHLADLETHVLTSLRRAAETEAQTRKTQTRIEAAAIQRIQQFLNPRDAGHPSPPRRRLGESEEAP